MNVLSPVQKVVNHLEQSGYKKLPNTLQLASLSFEFPAVVVSADSQSDLVIVVDTIDNDDNKLREKIEGVARALDVLRSKRSITTVVVGRRPDNDILNDISRYCRVLPLGAEDGACFETSLVNWLRVLTPLSLNELSFEVRDPKASLSAAAAEMDDEVFQRLIDANFHAADDVTELVADYFDKALQSLIPDVFK